MRTESLQNLRRFLSGLKQDRVYRAVLKSLISDFRFEPETPQKIKELGDFFAHSTKDRDVKDRGETYTLIQKLSEKIVAFIKNGGRTVPTHVYWMIKQKDLASYIVDTTKKYAPEIEDIMSDKLAFKLQKALIELLDGQILDLKVDGVEKCELVMEAESRGLIILYAIIYPVPNTKKKKGIFMTASSSEFPKGANLGPALMVAVQPDQREPGDGLFKIRGGPPKRRSF